MLVNDKVESRSGVISGVVGKYVLTPESSVIGHGLLSRFHAGCRCGWCTTQALERSCGCPRVGHNFCSTTWPLFSSSS